MSASKLLLHAAFKFHSWIQNVSQAARWIWFGCDVRRCFVQAVHRGGASAVAMDRPPSVGPQRSCYAALLCSLRDLARCALVSGPIIMGPASAETPTSSTGQQMSARLCLSRRRNTLEKFVNGQMVQIDQVNQLEARIFTTYGHNQVQSSRLPACNRLTKLRPRCPLCILLQVCLPAETHEAAPSSVFTDAQSETAGTGAGMVHWLQPSIARAPRSRTKLAAVAGLLDCPDSSKQDLEGS